MEVASHPDDLFIRCCEIKEHPGKYYLGIFRGKGHNYKPLITSEDPRSWGDGREHQLDQLRRILVGNGMALIYHGCLVQNYNEFVSYVAEAGFTQEWLGGISLEKSYEFLSSDGGPLGIIAALVDVNRSLNAAMIDEIMERFAHADSVDTSIEPLNSFPGPPTFRNRMAHW